MSGFQARTKLAETEKLLSGVLYERGVDSKGFAIIRSKGDKALFRLDTALLKRKLGAPDSRPLADLLPTISIKAKDSAAEMTSINVQQKIFMDSHQLKKNILRIIRLFGKYCCKMEANCIGYIECMRCRFSAPNSLQFGNVSW